MEKQDAAIPFRVRVDVSQRCAGGDSVALGVRISVVYLFVRYVGVWECAWRLCSKPDLGSCVLVTCE